MLGVRVCSSKINYSDMSGLAVLRLWSGVLERCVWVKCVPG